MVAYRLRLHLYPDQAEDRLQDHTVDEEGRTASVGGEILVAEAEEEAEAADSTTGASEAYPLASGEEAKHHQRESQVSAGEEDVAEKEEMTGVVAAGDEEEGGRYVVDIFANHFRHTFQLIAVVLCMHISSTRAIARLCGDEKGKTQHPKAIRTRLPKINILGRIGWWRLRLHKEVSIRGTKDWRRITRTETSS
jgi:hypothetical protein